MTTSLKKRLENDNCKCGKKIEASIFVHKKCNDCLWEEWNVIKKIHKEKQKKEEEQMAIDKLKCYHNDKKVAHDRLFDEEDNNAYYFYMVKLIYNSFIMGHILIDGNKRMFKKEMEELNKLVSVRSLE